MAKVDRILAAYEHGLRRLADDLVAELDPSEEDKADLMLVVQLLEAVVRTYDAFQLNRSPALEASKSVMYAAAAQPERRVLNVPLRSLVEHNTLTAWQARFLNGSIGLKRTIIVSGEANVGKSTLLNALVELIPRDQRVVVVDDADEELPAVRGRSFTVQLKAKRGTVARANTFRKAADMKPNWIVTGELARRDGPAFLEALAAGSSGLATIQTPDPEVTLTDWLAANRATPDQLNSANPIVVHMERDQGGRPRIDKVVEAKMVGELLVLTPRRPM
ncbi:MAG TPA: ATPase, T2SS/T4P/T4SS family [Thermoleophilia bacterium]